MNAHVLTTSSLHSFVLPKDVLNLLLCVLVKHVVARISNIKTARLNRLHNSLKAFKARKCKQLRKANNLKKLSIKCMQNKMTFAMKY